MVVWSEDPFIEIKLETTFQSLLKPGERKYSWSGTFFSCTQSGLMVVNTLSDLWVIERAALETRRGRKGRRECGGICNSGVPELKIPPRFPGGIRRARMGGGNPGHRLFVAAPVKAWIFDRQGQCKAAE